MATTISGTGGLSPSALPFIVGQVSFFAMAAAPSGFLKCNGAAISRTTYAALFAVMGTLYGAGDGSTTFNLPDLRGEFIRCSDDSRGVDVGRVHGSFQAEQVISHAHGLDHNMLIGNRSYSGLNSGVSQGGAYPKVGVLGDSGSFTVTAPFGGGETRPRNVALLACVFTGV